MKFEEKELNRMGSYKIPGIYGMPSVEIPKLDTPITPRENMIRMLKNEKPLWLPNQLRDNNALCPYVMPDSTARAYGGIDWFGIDWKFEKTCGASMVRPGTRRLSHIKNWRKEIVWPDLNAIDWEKDFQENYVSCGLPNDRFSYFVILNGMFERLADLTSFSDAFLYLLEEPDELNAFYEKLTDWHIKLIRIAKKYYHPDMILWHDDMGSQKNAFFSPDLYEEILLPHYQRITKAAHEEGMFITLHSCGCVGVQIENFIKAGFDAWEGQDGINNKDAIMEQYGDRLAQIGNFIIEESVSDEVAIEMIHQRVETLGKTGRYACRLHIYGAEKRKVDLADELYKISRIYYSEH